MTIAERAVIGSLLVDIKCMAKIYNRVSPEMFADPVLGSIYREILKAYDVGEDANMITLAQRVEGGALSRESLVNELRECMDATYTSAHVEGYAKTMINDYKARKLLKLINSTKPSSAHIEAQIASLISEAEALRDNREVRAKSMGSIVSEFGGLYFRESDCEKLYTGFQRLDGYLGGLEGGDIIVIGARPAVGKSAFVSQVILQMARQGRRIGFYNLEMTEKQVYERLLSNQSGIGLKRIRHAKEYLGSERYRVAKANEVLAKYDITISSGSKSVSEIRNECRHQGYDCIVIDYFQLVRADVRYNNRASEVGAISKALKGLAMELKTPIILLSQLNRLSETKQGKEPTMAELRESGDIEQDASVIVLMWNVCTETSTKGLKVEKNRQGETGKIAYIFDGGQMKFNEMRKEDEGWKSARESATPFDE